MPVAGIRLLGRLDRVNDDGQVGREYSCIWDKSYLGIWIRHLVLHLAAALAVERRTRWMAADTSLVFTPVAEPTALLESLVNRYREGMSRPLHLFPKTSLAAARQMHKRRDWDRMARGEWIGSEDHPGEGGRPYHRLAFGETYPLDAEFETLVRELLLPMLDCLEEEDA